MDSNSRLFYKRPQSQSSGMNQKRAAPSDYVIPVLFGIVMASVLTVFFIPLINRNSHGTKGSGFETDDDDDHHHRDRHRHHNQTEVFQQLTNFVQSQDPNSNTSGNGTGYSHWYRVKGFDNIFYSKIDGLNVILAAEPLSDRVIDWHLNDTDNSEDFANATAAVLMSVFSYNSVCFNTVVPNLRWNDSYDFYVHTENLEAACLSQQYVQCVIGQTLGHYHQFLSNAGWPFGNIIYDDTYVGLSRNGLNDMSFGAINVPDAEDILAVTSFWWEGTTILEWDQVYNTVTYHYGDVDHYSLDTLVDLQNVMTHEFIHVFGGVDVDTEDCTESTCYGYSTYRETKKRSVEIDDQNGLIAINGGVPIVQSASSICYNQNISQQCIAQLNPPAPSPTPASLIDQFSSSQQVSMNQAFINTPYDIMFFIMTTGMMALVLLE